MANIIINADGNSDNTELLNLVKELIDENKKLEEIILNLDEKFNLLSGKVSGLDDNINKLNTKLDNVSIDSVSEDMVKNYSEVVKALDTYQDIVKSLDIDKKHKKSFDEKVSGKKTVKKYSKKKKSGKDSSISERKRNARRLKDSDVYVPNESVSRLWKNIVLRPDGSLLSKGHKKFVLPVNLNELLYIIEKDTPYMNRGLSKELQSKFNVNISTWGKLIYNIRCNSFDDIIVDYYNRIHKIKFKVNDDNELLIDKVNTHISKNLVYDWLQLMNNSNHKEETILNIQESNPKFDKYNIRIICDSYNNNVLSKLVAKPPVKEFVENNPSKRRNLINNGGLL